MSRLLMVGCGWTGRPCQRRARDRAMRVAVRDRARGLEWERDSLGPRDQGYPLTGEGEETWQAAAAKALVDRLVDTVLAFSVQHVVASARLAAELGLPGPRLRAALTSHNKHVQRDLFGRHNLSQLGHQFFYQLEHALERVGEHSPAVVKPLSGMSGGGVVIVTDEIRLEILYERHPAGMPFLVEQYLDGREFSVEATIDRGEFAFHGLTERTTTRPPFCVGTDRRLPVDRPAAERAAVHDPLAGSVRTLGISSGIGCLELRIEPDGPHIMEVAGRILGDNIMGMVQAANGLDPYDAAIAGACGEPGTLPPLADDGAACVWFPTPPPGVVTAIEGADRIAGLPGMVDIEVYVEVGGTVPPLRSSLDRVAMVIVRADDGDTPGHRLRAVQDELRLLVHPAEESVQQHTVRQHTVHQDAVHQHTTHQHALNQQTVLQQTVLQRTVLQRTVLQQVVPQQTVGEGVPA